MRFLFALVICAACNNSAPTSDLAVSDDLGAPDLSIYTLQYPQLTNHGGPVMASMQLWTAVWAGDEVLGSQLNAFHRDMFDTGYYWTGILGQYGVGKGTAMGIVVVPGPKPTTLAHDAIPGLAASSAAQLPSGANSNTVVTVLIPKTTTVTGIPDKLVGYHNHIGTLPFIVLTQRPANLGGPFNDLTYFASHEVAEVATNPTAPTAWFDDALGPTLGEIGDVCNPLDAVIYAVGDGGADSQYLVARLYHNQAAAMGKDPCWHYPLSAPYFNIDVVPRQVTLSGGTGTTTLHLFSKAKASAVGDVDWSIEGIPAGMTVTPSKGTNQVGDTINVQITGPSGANVPLAVFSTSQTTTFNNVWWFLVLP